MLKHISLNAVFKHITCYTQFINIFLFCLVIFLYLKRKRTRYGFFAGSFLAEKKASECAAHQTNGKLVACCFFMMYTRAYVIIILFTIII